MELFGPDIQQGLELAGRVDPKYAPAWRGRPAREQAGLAMYFLPHGSGKPVLGVTRPRVVKWYCPFADQRTFASGHRYCINVYTGCSHGCVYCYAAGYLAMEARAKADFRRLLGKDLADLDAFDVPPAPVHLSNSTDPFQAIERRCGDSLFTLRQLARCRQRFTTITLLTKNPGMLAEPDYLAAVRELDHPGGCPGRVIVEVSLAFWREEIAAAYHPGAPPVADRLAGIRALRQAGLAVVLRISPTYPIDIATGTGVALAACLPVITRADKLPVPPASDGSPNRLGCPQTAGDIENLARFAAEVGVCKVVHTPAKIVRPKSGQLHPLMRAMLQLYRRLARPVELNFHGGAWRLPAEAAHRHVVEPVSRICARHGVPVGFCMTHLVRTK